MVIAVELQPDLVSDDAGPTDAATSPAKVTVDRAPGQVRRSDGVSIGDIDMVAS